MLEYAPRVEEVEEVEEVEAFPSVSKGGPELAERRGILLTVGKREGNIDAVREAFGTYVFYGQLGRYPTNRLTKKGHWDPLEAVWESLFWGGYFIILIPGILYYGRGPIGICRAQIYCRGPRV